MMKQSKNIQVNKLGLHWKMMINELVSSMNDHFGND